MNLHHLREDYQRESLDVADVASDPFAQFKRWMQECLEAKLPEPNAFTLSTVSADGQPSGRVVLLKELDGRGLVFYTNHESKKASEIATNPKASATFLWLELQRQVRVEGVLEKLDRQTAEAYFQTRPIGSQLGAWASHQSAEIESRQWLEDSLADAERRFNGVAPIPMPENWGGYRLLPHYFEFWQGRPSRLHDRVFYKQEAEGWKLGRLCP